MNTLKTVKVSGLMGKIQIPRSSELVTMGFTQRGDEVAVDAKMSENSFVRVAVGGVPISKYYAVIRPIRGEQVRVWRGTKKAFLPKKKKLKKAKKAKKAVRRKKGKK